MITCLATTDTTVVNDCMVVDAQLFEATDTAARFLWTSQDSSGNGVVTTGRLYYRVQGSTTWLFEEQATESSSFNVFVGGLTPSTDYEWYAESCPDATRVGCCVSSENMFRTVGDTPAPSGDCTVKATANYAAWEVELVSEFGGWIEKAANGSTSGAWYDWRGGNRFFLSEAGLDILEYTVCIVQEGDYQFSMHSFADNIGTGTASDMANDVWVKFPTGTDVSGQVDAVQGWIKAFRNGSFADQWTWVTQAEHNGNQWPTVQQHFTAGNHKIQLSGRSNGHGLDRLVLSRVGTGTDPGTTTNSTLTDCATKSLPASSLYSSGCDRVALHYDVAPDLDDLHAIAGGCSLSRCFGISPDLVIGTHGQNDAQREVEYNDPNNSKQGQAFGQYATTSRRDLAKAVADAAYGAGNYLDTGGGGWTTAVNAQADKWKTTVQTANCKVHVAEGGTSDFTSDVLRRLKALGCTDAQIKDSVHVYQHGHGVGSFNEGQAVPANLTYTQNASTYVKIDNGNVGGNSTADLEDAGSNTTNSAFALWARGSECSGAWIAALDRFSAKIDFSDTVEYLHITGVPLSQVSDITSFCGYVD